VDCEECNYCYDPNYQYTRVAAGPEGPWVISGNHNVYEGNSDLPLTLQEGVTAIDIGAGAYGALVLVGQDDENLWRRSSSSEFENINPTSIDSDSSP